MRTFSLPDQRNQAGKFLSTDGTNVFWDEAGGGGGGMAIGGAIAGSSMWQVLYTAPDGTLTSDALFFRLPGAGGSFSTFIISQGNGNDARLELGINGFTLNYSVGASSSLFAIASNGTTITVVSNNILFRFPVVVGPTDIWTPLMHNGNDLMSVSIPFLMNPATGVTSLGSTGAVYDTFVIGAGVTANNALTATIRPTNKVGTNLPGNGLVISSGMGTGNAVPTNGILFRIPAIGTSGATSQTPTNAIEITPRGLIRTYLIHNNLDANGTVSQPELRSAFNASSNPTGVTNIVTGSISLSRIVWNRVGNVVTVSGRVTAEALGAGLTTYRMSLPVASTFVLTEHLNGVIVEDGNSGGVTDAGIIKADTTNNEALVSIYLTAGNMTDFSYTYSYVVV